MRGVSSSARTTDLALLTGSENQAFGVQPVQTIPVEAFPGSRTIVQSQIQGRANGLINFVSIDL
jgi:hypothetical protein